MNGDPDFLNNNPPSRIHLAIPPLTATLGSAELEHAAALLVRYCQIRGDRWQAVHWDDLELALREDLAAKIEPMWSLLRNPFFSPQFDALVEKQWAAWHGTPGVGELELAPRAIALFVEKWGRQGDRRG